MCGKVKGIKMQVGNKVTFKKQTCDTVTPILLNSVGILCDKTDEEELNCYVVFNQINYTDWFNEDELEDLGAVE